MSAGIVAEKHTLHERVGQFMSDALAAWQTPGAIVSIVHDDRVVLAKGYGTRCTGTEVLPDAGTRFAIGSLSKAFGAASIACLVDRGLVGWDDRVQRHLPWFELADPWVSHEVRIRDLLAHRVGSDFMIEDRLVPVITSGEDFVRRIRHLEPAAGFRSRYVYSNAMFVAVGLLVEAVTGKTWAQFTRETLWEPLGMSRTTTDFRAVLQSENHATPHRRVDGALHALHGWEAEREAFDYSRPSGAIISTADDMAQWMRLQLGAGRREGREIISAQNFAQLHTPHTPIRGGLREVIYWFTHLESADILTRHWAYGLGWWITDFRGCPMVCHTGTAAGFRGAVLMLPQEHLGVYVGVNLPTELPFAAALTVLDICLRDPQEDWSRLFLDQARRRELECRAFERARELAREPNTQPSLPLHEYAGAYCDRGALGELRVRCEAEALFLTLGHEEGRLAHWHHDVFAVDWRGVISKRTFSTFMLDPRGAVRSIDLEGSGTFVRRANT